VEAAFADEPRSTTSAWQWIRLEADPTVISFCEHPARVDADDSRRLIEFWVVADGPSSSGPNAVKSLVLRGRGMRIGGASRVGEFAMNPNCIARMTFFPSL
jgi:hypothetical protein